MDKVTLCKNKELNNCNYKITTDSKIYKYKYMGINTEKISVLTK